MAPLVSEHRVLCAPFPRLSCTLPSSRFLTRLTHTFSEMSNSRCSNNRQGFNFLLFFFKRSSLDQQSDALDLLPINYIPRIVCFPSFISNFFFFLTVKCKLTEWLLTCVYGSVDHIQLMCLLH